MFKIEYAYRRFSKRRFALPTEAQVQDLEQRIGVTFPEDFRQFILEFNGGYFTEPNIEPVSEGCPQDALVHLNGINASPSIAELCSPRSMSLFDDNSPPVIVPIGSTSMGGLILLDTAPDEYRGSIYLKKAFGDSYYLAEGIEEFFGLLREPMDE